MWEDYAQIYAQSIMDDKYSLSAVNGRLKDGGGKATLIVRGSTIWVLATFPPKPGSDRDRPYQQKFTLNLPATDDGFKRAEREARIIGSELAIGQFKWGKYIAVEKLPENKPCAQWIKEFKSWYLARNDLHPATWEKDWMGKFNRLPQGKPLTVDVMQRIILKTDPHTRNRLETCRKFQHLANFAKFEADFLELEGSYGPSKVKSRDIPSDEVIAAQWDKIKNPGWRWVYGMMAAFGLRDHEVFFCEWTDGGLQVLKGKTGPRLVFQPLYPEWEKRWDLRSGQPPKLQNPDELYEKRQLGTKVSRAFKRQGIPFTPYDLRHAYGIRTSALGLQVPDAAALMGHSAKVHLERYHKHTKLKQHKEAVDRVMSRIDRPIAP